ncbi:uncharacterized protein LOC123703531 isoform X2 [Colias croceus]|uniref:uncharacterized protein LOC123703531 isoform X2 n=1 Tax=Colias crocea TaxID=72248 RepID=UPI001E27D2D3|nr:uncharacterized protein LOC123703531 isoform X2 [Colias croceus]
MTSTNDGKDVKSNPKSSQKGKTYYIELYKSLESRLSGESSGDERTRCVGEAWRRVHSLCGHSAPSTHPHLLCWLQRHTAKTVLQTEWPKSHDQHTILIDAIDAFLQDCTEAISRRNGERLVWETQLQQWAEGFKKILPNPWGHPVLQALLGGQVPGDEEILEWLKQERGVMLVTRLRQMVASKSCVDLALKLAATLRTRTRPAMTPDADGAPESTEAAQETTEFADVLRQEAGFTPDVWNFLMDIEFVLLDKVNNRPACIELAKQIPFREACPLVERLNNRLESSPQEKKLWKNAKEVAALVAQVVIARCMLVPVCRGDVLIALYGCFRSVVHMLGEEKLATCSVGLAALATTARHLHTMAAAAHKQLKGERTPFVCQLYVRAITAGMNELEKLKLATEKEAEARSTEQTLSSWFNHLGSLLSASHRLSCECLLTAFSVHPSPAMYDKVKGAPLLEAIKDLQEPNLETTSEFGSWATDSRTQTNLVKTSETLNMKHIQKQANVLSTAIFTEGEALGLEPELCNDLAVLLSGPRVKTLTWDMEREVLLENCRTYMERTHGGTRALTTELKYLNLDPRSYEHLPEEDDNEDDVYYGIEKGYEHLLEAQEASPEYHPQLWQDPFLESPSISSDESLMVVKQRKKKKKRALVVDPLKLDSETNSNKETERSNSIGRTKSTSRDATPHHSQSSQDADHTDTKPSIESKEDKKLKKEKKQELKKEKKEVKERKKREKSNIRRETKTDKQEEVGGNLARLVGMKVVRKTDEEDKIDRNNALKLQSINNDGKMAQKADQNKLMDNKNNKLNNISNESKPSDKSHENSSVVFDGLFSMEDMKFPDTQIIAQDKTHNILSFNPLNPPPLARIKPDVKDNTSKLSTNNKINEEVKTSVKRLIDFRRHKPDHKVGDLLQCKETLLSEQALLETARPKLVPVPDIPTAVIAKNLESPNVPKPQSSKETNTRNNVKSSENKSRQKTNKLHEKAAKETASQRAFEEFLKLQSYKAVNLLASGPRPQPIAKVDNVTQKKFEHLLGQNVKNPSSKINKSKPQDLSQNSVSQKVTPKPPCNVDVPINKDVTPNPTQIPDTKYPTTIYDPTQQHFQNFLKELQQSINAGTFVKQKPENKSAEKLTGPKILKQKIADNAPNTFARLSYLHKSKQMENKMKTEEKMRAKIDSNQLTTDLDKMLHLQSNGQIVISRVNKNQVKKSIDPIPVRSAKKETSPISKIAQNHPHLISSIQAKSTIVNYNPNINLHNNLNPQYSTNVKVETASTSTALSEKDQADLVLLLRQKNKLNAGYFAQNNTNFNNQFYSSCSTTNIIDSTLKCQPNVQTQNSNLLQQPIHNSISNISKQSETSVIKQISGSSQDLIKSIPISNEIKTNINTNTVIKTVNSVAPKYIQFKVVPKDEQEVYEIKNDLNLKESCNFRDSKPKKEIIEHVPMVDNFTHLDEYLRFHNNFQPVQPLHVQNMDKNTNEVAPAIIPEPQMNMFTTSNMEIRKSEKDKLNIMICPSTQEKVETIITPPVKHPPFQVKPADTKKKSVPKVAQTATKPQPVETPKSDWESVLDDLLKHKTPSRGPKALDVALKKDSFDKHLPQKQKTETSTKKGRGVNNESAIKNDDAAAKNTIDSQGLQPFKETNSLNSVLDKKPNEPNSTQKFVKVNSKEEEDPFISGIHNSDYDLLDELMDEDLRQEIDDAYCPIDLYTPKEKETLNTTSSTFMTTENFIPKEITKSTVSDLCANIPKSTVSDLCANIGTNVQNNVIKCNNPKSVILNIPKRSSSIAPSDSKPRVISNELIVSKTKVDKNISKKSKAKQNITQKPTIKADTKIITNNLQINPKQSEGVNITTPIISIVKKSRKGNCISNIYKNKLEIPTSSIQTVDPARVIIAPQLKASQNLMMDIGVRNNSHQLHQHTLIASSPYSVTATSNVGLNNLPPTLKQVVSPVIVNNFVGSALTKTSINTLPTQKIITLDGRDIKLQSPVIAANNLSKNNVTTECSIAHTQAKRKNLTTKSGLNKTTKVKDDAKNYLNRGSCLVKSIVQNMDALKKPSIDEAILNNERKVLSEVQEKLQHVPSEKCEPKNNIVINKKNLFDKDIKAQESTESKNNIVTVKKKIFENEVKSCESKEINSNQILNEKSVFKNKPTLQESFEEKNTLPADNKKIFEESGVTKNILTIQKNLIENPLYSKETVDKERIQNKRMLILNKQSIHNYCRDPIALSYSPLNQSTPVDKKLKIEKTHTIPAGSVSENIAKNFNLEQTLMVSRSRTCQEVNKKEVKKCYDKVSLLEKDCVDKILSEQSNIDSNLSGNTTRIIDQINGVINAEVPVVQQKSNCYLKSPNDLNICEEAQSSQKLGKSLLKSKKGLLKQNDTHSAYPDIQKDLRKVVENLSSKIPKLSSNKQTTEIKNITTNINETVKAIDITDDKNKLIQSPNLDKICKLSDENQIPESTIDVMNSVLRETKNSAYIKQKDISISTTAGIESNLNSSKGFIHTKIEEHTNSSNKEEKVKTDPLLDKYRDQIYFEEVPREPNDDPLKRVIRIKLPNGSTFRATISGKLDINVDSIFTDPQMKSILFNSTIKNKKCTLNLRQVTVADKNNSAEKNFVNEILYPKNLSDDPETINLISDDEEASSEEPIKYVFQTEFGDYCVPLIEKEELLKHQKRFSQKCSVRIERGDIFKKIRAAKSCLSLESNKICGVQDLQIVDEKLLNEDDDNIIEIDDSSNDSVSNINIINSPKRESNIRPKLSTDLDVLKNSIIKGLRISNTLETIVDDEPTILEENESAKIGDFESILRESMNEEKTKWMSSCFVKLIRCDSDISINNDKEDADVTPDDLPSCLHRSGSFSILNDYLIDNVNLGDYITNKTDESSEIKYQRSLHCDSEWLLTKASLHDIALKNVPIDNCIQSEERPLNEIHDVSTDYESDLDSNSSLTTEHNINQCVLQNQKPPSLVSIVTKYFANNPMIDLLKPIVRTIEEKSVQSVNLKRKTMYVSDQDITKCKISKTNATLNKKLKCVAPNDTYFHNIVNTEAVEGNCLKNDIMVHNETVEEFVTSDEKTSILNKDEIQISTTKQEQENKCENNISSNLKEDKIITENTSSDTIFSDGNDDLSMTTSTTKQEQENICENNISSNLKEDKIISENTSSDTIFSDGNDGSRMITSTTKQEQENVCENNISNNLKEDKIITENTSSDTIFSDGNDDISMTTSTTKQEQENICENNISSNLKEDKIITENTSSDTIFSDGNDDISMTTSTTKQEQENIYENNILSSNLKEDKIISENTSSDTIFSDGNDDLSMTTSTTKQEQENICENNISSNLKEDKIVTKNTFSDTIFSDGNDGSRMITSTTKQEQENVCENNISSNLKEDKIISENTSSDTIFLDGNDCLRMTTSSIDEEGDSENLRTTSCFDYTYIGRCVVEEFLKREKESWHENSIQVNKTKYEGITDIKNSTDDMNDNDSISRERTLTDEHCNIDKLKNLQTTLCVDDLDTLKVDNINEAKENLTDSILVKAETKDMCKNIKELAEKYKNVTIDESPDVLNENIAASINDDKAEHTELSEINQTSTDMNLKPKDVPLCHKTNNNNLELVLPKSNVSVQNNVTLLYSANSELMLKGSEYKDPKIGTCYLFPLRKYLKKGEENKVFNVLTVKTEHSNNGVIENTPDEDDFHIIIPKLTYSRHRMDTNSSLQYLNSFIKRNLKRKRGSVDTKNNEKRYRKGKNIDYPKLTVTAMEKSAYVKEFNRLINYWNNVEFSFSRSYNEVENFDVCDLLKSWPIQGTMNVLTSECNDENVLFICDNDEVKFDNDPLRKSFAEELASEYQENEYKSIEINETNFSMGFGEGSDRVIQSYVDRNTLPKISAATLSDVKHAQPFLSFEYSENLNKTSEDKIEVTERYISYIRLKDKVRSFFKRTAIELNKDWILNNTKECKNNSNMYENSNFPFDVNNLDFFGVPYCESVVQVVQVGQLPVSAAAQNPVTCDPRVTQVTDASPPQCSAENSPPDGSQASMKTEYTELTTADLSIPSIQEYDRHNQTMNMLSQENHKMSFSDENIPIETEVNSIVKIEIAEEVLENEEQNENVENELMNSVSNHDSNRNYTFDSNTVNSMDSQDALSFESLNNCTPYSQHEEQSESSEKTDQIAHAMNAAGINTHTESIISEESQTIGNVLCDKSNEESGNVTQTSHESYTNTTTISALALQQALAQILPPPLNRTNSSENNNQNSNTPSPQVLHIVQGKNSSVNQLTLVDNSQKSVINASNSTPVLHIVQNKGTSNSSTSSAQQSNSFNGLSLVDGSNIQQGSNQLLHIVNSGSQKSNGNTGQLLKRVNLLTNLSNVQGNTEQKMVQFVCKSADGKSIQLNAPHQRSMVLRLQPIESTNVQNNNCTKKSDNQNDLNSNQTTNITNSTNGNEGMTIQQEIKSRSVYEENYAKFIQNAGKPSAPEKSTSLPKFNQAFGKQVFQDENQKVSDMNENHSHMSSVNTTSENSDCQSDNSMNIEQMGQMSSPPLLLRKSPVQITSQSPSQSNLVQQIKQTITPMNLQTMHGGVIYTRQIPVNIGGGQTINLITVPSTELVDDSNQKQHNQSDMEQSIIKIVPQNQTASNTEMTSEDNRNHGSNDCNQSTQPQVLTQMRIKLPMLSKPSQMVSGTRVVRPSFFQIQRNVIGGANQPVYQQLVLTAAPPLGQQTIRLPQTQTNRLIKIPSETNQTSPESQMSSSTLEQLREFDMVLEQVKERSTVQPNQTPTSNTFNKIHISSTDAPEVTPSSNMGPSESTQQVLYTIGNNASLNVAYVNRKTTVTTSSPSVSTFVRSPDSSNINDSPSSSSQNQLPHSSSSEAQTSEMSSAQNQHKAAKINTKTKSRPKSSSHPSSSVKINTVTPKPSTQKPFEDEQTTQRILYILAEYKEQVENSPDKDKPAPRRRSNPPSNPGSSKRKKSSSGSRRSGTRDMSPVHGEDTCRTMGSEDSSCGTSQGDCTESCLDSHSPQDSPRKVARKLTFEHETPTLPPRPQPQRNVIVADGQTITVARSNAGKPTTAVLMPANYILPVSMVKSGQQIAIVTNRGPKILTVGGGEGGGNAVLLQRLIGPGLKPVLARPGVRHVRLPAAALHNLQAFTLGQAAASQQPDSTAPSMTPNPPELVDTRATASPWAEREGQDSKLDKQPSPESSEPWNLTSSDPHDYSYEEIVRGDNMDRTVLVVHRKDGTTQRHHRLTHVSAAALRHRYAILEHELRLQKSLSEECEDLGVDSPSASELFPEAELLFSSSPAHEAPHHSHTRDWHLFQRNRP